MDSLTEQQSLLDQLGDLMHRSASPGHTACRGLFKYHIETDGGDFSTGAQFSYELDGQWVPAHLLFLTAASRRRSFQGCTL